MYIKELNENKNFLEEDLSDIQNLYDNLQKIRKRRTK